MQKHLESLRALFHTPPSSWDWSLIAEYAQACGDLGWEYVAENLRAVSHAPSTDREDNANFLRLLVKDAHSTEEIVDLFQEYFGWITPRFPDISNRMALSVSEVQRALLRHKGRCVRVLDLSGIRLDEETFALVVETFDFSQTQRIDLSGCNVSADGLEYFLTLHTDFPALTHLNLSLNALHDPSAEHLATLLNAPKLQSLRVMRAMLSHVGRCMLLDRFGEIVHAGLFGVQPKHEEIFSVLLMESKRDTYALQELYIPFHPERDPWDCYTRGMEWYGTLVDVFWGPVKYKHRSLLSQYARVGHHICGVTSDETKSVVLGKGREEWSYIILDACGDIVSRVDVVWALHVNPDVCPHNMCLRADQHISYISLVCEVYAFEEYILQDSCTHLTQPLDEEKVLRALHSALRFDMLRRKDQPIVRGMSSCMCTVV